MSYFSIKLCIVNKHIINFQLNITKTMKTKHIFLSTILIIFLSSQVKAQEVGDIRLGAKLSYITIEGADLGIGIVGDYQFTESIIGSVNYNYFLADEFLGLSTINLDGLYTFGGDGIRPYVLAGLNIATVSVNFDLFGVSEKVSNTEIGINLGGGAELPLSDKMAAFGELKYALASIDELVISAGLKFNLN